MSANFEPTPPTRQPGGFPKTTTLPEGWVMDELMEYYNGRDSASQPVKDPTETPQVPDTGRRNGKSHPAEASAGDESPFARKLEPFPSQADLRRTWL